jgi:hypothetical protein
MQCGRSPSMGTLASQLGGLAFPRDPQVGDCSAVDFVGGACTAPDAIGQLVVPTKPATPAALLLVAPATVRWLVPNVRSLAPALH